MEISGKMGGMTGIYMSILQVKTNIGVGIIKFIKNQ